jgi:hypothetical protein
MPAEISVSWLILYSMIVDAIANLPAYGREKFRL